MSTPHQAKYHVRLIMKCKSSHLFGKFPHFIKNAQETKAKETVEGQRKRPESAEKEKLGA